MNAPAPAFWYFAYGSNLDPRTFRGRRRMRPLSTRTALLDGYALTFDLPVGPGERGVANVRPDPYDSVEGVAYLISAEQARWLDRTEGVHRGAYRRIAVELIDVDGERFDAFTYWSPFRRTGRKPSERYLGLLLTGARHHGLSAAWIERLDALERARDERRP